MKKIIAIAVLLALFAGCKKDDKPGTVELKGISFTEESVSLEKGGQKALSLVFTPADATDKSVTWLTSNPAVATVSDGIVTGIGAGQADISAKAGVYTSTCKVTVTVTLKGIQLQKEISVNRGETATLTATLEPSDATADITWESSDESVVTVSEGELTGVGVGTATVTAKAGSIKAECAVTILPPKGAVDLGIEITRADGTKYTLYWAECNLGAEKPEDYGDYYAWGDVEPNYRIQDPLTWKEGKTGYDWASYKWCNGAANKLTKYCPADKADYWDGEGSPDGKIVLEPEDDAAHVILGGKWRMPTDEEWTELRTKCEWTWTSDYNGTGVSGRIITAPNGNSIFLPAAGYRYDFILGNAGSFGGLWSSSLNTDYPYLAFYVTFKSGGVERSYNSLCYGYSVRPVTE